MNCSGRHVPPGTADLHLVGFVPVVSQRHGDGTRGHRTGVVGEGEVGCDEVERRGKVGRPGPSLVTGGNPGTAVGTAGRDREQQGGDRHEDSGRDSFP